MNGYGSSEEHQPLTWVRGQPIFAAHMVAGVLVISMIVTTLVMATKVTGLLTWLPFSSVAVLNGEVWRIFTYGLMNPPSLSFAIDMVLIVWFGRELEKFFGHRLFLYLFGGIYLLTPLVLTIVGLGRPTYLAGESGALALFVAFATLYPNVPLFFNLLAKWIAAILVGLYTLMALSQRDEIGLITLWTAVGFAFAFVRYQQGHFTLPRFSLGRRRPKLRVLPDAGTSQVRASEPRSNSSMAEIDALLDKIAQSGLHSLTPKERAKLDAARDDLLKRESRRD